MKHKRLSSFMKKYPMLFPLLAFTIFYYYIAFVHLANEFIIWDEAVYIGMGKFIYSGGASGFFEVLRPLLLPSIIGFFWAIGLHMITLKLVFPIIALATIYLTYVIAYKLIKSRFGAAVAGVLMGLTPMFFMHSPQILTDIPSVFFSLLCINTYLNRRYYLAGLFAGLAFLTRFTYGLVTIGIILHLAILLFFHKEKAKEVILKGLKFSIIVLATIVPFFVFNYFFYRAETSEWYHAAFRPIIYSYNTISHHGVHIYQEGFFFYFIEIIRQNVFLLLALAGIYYYAAHGRKDKSGLLIMVFLALFSLYFSSVSHKELRYAISFLPFLAIFSASGLMYLMARNKVKRFRKQGTYLLVILLALLFTYQFVDYTGFSGKIQGYTEFNNLHNKYFKNNPIDGPIITTTPNVAVYVDNEIKFSTYLPQIKEYLRGEASAIVLTNWSLVCNPGDSVCSDLREEAISNIIVNNNLISETTFEGSDYYIFSNVPYLFKISKKHLMQEYGLAKYLTLSNNPQDKFVSMIILEDMPSIEDPDDPEPIIWKYEAYDELISYLDKENMTVSIAAIPMHMNLVNGTEITRLSRHDIIQNGYTHKQGDLINPMESQTEKIIKGRLILENLTGKKIEGFIPPFYLANEDTASALERYGYKFYVSTAGDYTDLKINRYDQTLTLFNTWRIEDVKSVEQLKQEISRIRIYDNYILVSFYYFYDNTDVEYFSKFVDLLNDTKIMTVGDYDSWRTFRDKVNLTANGSQIILQGPDHEFSELLTLNFLNSGNYTLQSDYDTLLIKNSAPETNTICIKEKCHQLLPSEVKRIP